MNKSRPVDLSQTNIAGLGTDLEKKLRLDAGQHEDAWKGVGQQPGLKVWRIEQFQVKPVPEKDYGRFFGGDSYIVLNTYKKPDAPKLYHDIHFWIGLETSQDEAGTAAYKTVELDDHLGTLPVQHREVQGSESPLFLSYFKFFRVESGGVASGFRHEEPKAYRPRLLHIRSLSVKTVTVSRTSASTLVIREVPLSYKSLNSGDVFVLDLGLQLLQWNGSKASGVEKAKAAEFVRKLDDERKGMPTVTVFEEGDASAAPFWDAIGGQGPVASAEEGDKQAHAPAFEKVLYRLSNNSGKLEFKQEAKGTVKKSMLDSKDVFIYDSGLEVTVWVGNDSDKEERRRAMEYALEYIKQQGRPVDIPVSRVVEGGGSAAFDASFSA
ncbi:hypothetical protein HK104_005538 [Borealophlyctis nickersoniae]|nr:hypothetical protein HK104_005538 [Borealophlyctis nickersoniae]